MEWSKAVQIVNQHVVKIETPSGHGTGFLAFYNYDKTWCGIATANHVVAYADDWQLPIRIANEASTRFLTPSDRVIYKSAATDTAVVLFLVDQLQLPESPIALTPMSKPVDIGGDVGWLGYPAIEPNALCFFSGKISAAGTGLYLIDGVAINGVSGGPVFHLDGSDLQIMGCVSAYQPNLATGVSLPGLSYARDVSHFHDAATHVQNIDDATKKKAEFDSQHSGLASDSAGSPQAGTAPQFAQSNKLGES